MDHSTTELLREHDRRINFANDSIRLAYARIYDLQKSLDALDKKLLILGFIIVFSNPILYASIVSLLKML